MTVHIKLHGSKADRFEEIEEEIAQQLGYEPSNPEVLGILMAGIDENMDITPGVSTSARS